MDKYSFKNKFQYWFDNKMSKGIAELIKVLAVLTAFIILFIGALIAFFDLSNGYNFGQGVWSSLNHILDPGLLGGDEGSFIYLVSMTIVTFIGIFVSGTLIGLISNTIDEKIQELRRGKSIVLEKNHVIVLGASNGINTIISELIEANANQKREAVVIMDDNCLKDEMDEKFHQRFPDTKTTKIICRNGNIADYVDLQVCSFDTCRSVIINADNDSLTIKSILAATKLLKETNNTQAYIVAMIRSDENLDAAQVAGEGRVEVLSYNDVIARIVAHTSRSPGLSKVYTEIFDYEGSEFYIEEHPSMIGKKMKELNLYYAQAVVIGIKDVNGDILVNPSPDRIYQQGEKLILFAEDDGVAKPAADAYSFDESMFAQERTESVYAIKNLLILGYNDKLEKIVQEEDLYVGKGSILTIAISKEQEMYRDMIEKIPTKNLLIEVIVCDLKSRSELKNLVENKESILLLIDSNSDMSLEDEEKADAQTLLLLLQLKYISETYNLDLQVASEMIRVENQELAQITEVNDFIVSSNMTSLIMTQISQSRELNKIFTELLSEEGSEIYVKPAKDYIKLNQPVDFFTVQASANRYNEIVIGYHKHNRHKLEIVTNPNKREQLTFGEDDSFIVIALD